MLLNEIYSTGTDHVTKQNASQIMLQNVCAPKVLTFQQQQLASPSRMDTAEKHSFTQQSKLLLYLQNPQLMIYFLSLFFFVFFSFGVHLIFEKTKQSWGLKGFQAGRSLELPLTLSSSLFQFTDWY